LVKTALFLLLFPAAWAQPLRVYSEFAQIDPRGRVTAPAEPREILSPAIARNAFSSFQVVVDVPQGTPYQLYVAQNPENAVDVTLYRETGDKLERVDLPVSGNAAQVFWMDLWTARDAAVQRIKVEPQLHVNNDWVIYPIEARVVSVTVPDLKWEPQTGGMPPVNVMRQSICSTAMISEFPSGNGFAAQNMRYRNAQQDSLLARSASKEELQKIFGACDAPPSPDPEWYLRIRDYLLRLR
jgi:hypothetical protein